MRTLLIAVWICFAFGVSDCARSDDPSGEPAASEDEAAEDAVNKDGVPIDPTGRFSNDLIDESPRYFLWHDTSGWHLRTTSSRGTFSRFDGTIRVTGGTFEKFRPIGLERRGRNPDKWELAADRDELTFEIATNSGFDGFDFSVDGAGARVEFDLNIAKKPYRSRIIIGRNGEFPSATKFAFPADP